MTDNAENFLSPSVHSTRGIGRLNFFAGCVLINVAGTIIFETLLDTADPRMGLFPLSIMYSAIMAFLIEKRAINIGIFPTWPSSHISMTAFLILAPLNFWICSSAANADPMGIMMSQAASILITVPVGIFLLLMPDREKLAVYRERRNLNKTKKNLIKEKKALLMTQEIENLKTEINSLRGDKL